MGNLSPLWAQGVEEVRVWEYAPYEVEIAYAFESAQATVPAAQQEFLEQLRDYLKNTFRAAWRVHMAPISVEHLPLVVRRFDQFALQDIRATELVLVVSLQHEDAKIIRTYDAAAEHLPAVMADSVTAERVGFSARELGESLDEDTAKLIDKLQVVEGGLPAVFAGLREGTIAGALVPRTALPDVAEFSRPLITLLPWQTDHLLRRQDKVIYLVISDDEGQWRIRARELDCPMQYMGEAFEERTPWWDQAPRVAASVIQRAFAPIARVEEAEARSAKIRLRAGGLIVDDGNPARIRVGDVLQPIVRRNDRYGVPTLLEPLKWTFAAVIASDGVHADVNVYTYSGGPGLQGRKNRRTQRVLLRVRPKYPQTDLQLVVRGEPEQTIAGSFIYNRDLLTEQFDLLGRTDWRGIFTIPVPAGPVRVLPEEIRAARFRAKREKELEEQRKRQAEEARRAAAEEGEPVGDAPAAPPQEKSAASTSSQEQDLLEVDPANDPHVVALNFPLMLVYVKNGDTVLAKLPMVPGLRQREVAELPDDRRRLRSEAFVRGFQGEVLDMVGLRSLLAAQIQMYVKEKDRQRAEAALRHLRRLPNYTEMADRLERIQREMLNEENGPITRSERARIDRMFQITRDMLQKYMQDDLLPRSEQLFRQAFGAETPQATGSGA
ncbi:MAG: hypothetical protein D6753_00145 [Planctomycetota bacterium]|nr:MAG: hypothetical protein D6753_00145 [Planctomycetota bacterium]